MVIKMLNELEIKIEKLNKDFKKVLESIINQSQLKNTITEI